MSDGFGLIAFLDSIGESREEAKVERARTKQREARAYVRSEPVHVPLPVYMLLLLVAVWYPPVGVPILVLFVFWRWRSTLNIRRGLSTKRLRES